VNVYLGTWSTALDIVYLAFPPVSVEVCFGKPTGGRGCGAEWGQVTGWVHEVKQVCMEQGRCECEGVYGQSRCKGQVQRCSRGGSTMGRTVPNEFC